MNGYDLSRNFWNWAFDNPEKSSPSLAAIYFFAVEHCNRLGGKEKFGFPSQMTMDAIGISKHQTYMKYFNQLVEYGFIKLVQKSKNQYSANIISIVNAIPKKGKALDKAFIRHGAKQTWSLGQSKHESEGVSDGSIVKQVTNKQINKEQGNKRFSPPSLEEVDEMFLEKGLDFDESKKESQKFVDHYESVGWKVGKNKMQKWKSAASGWFNRIPDFKKEKSSAKKESRDAMGMLMKKHNIPYGNS